MDIAGASAVASPSRCSSRSWRLGALANRYPNELSGGEQQRVTLLSALVADTGLVLCDEPLSISTLTYTIDYASRSLLLCAEAGATAIYITHDQSEAFALADRIGLLDHGHLVQLDAPESIYFHPKTPFVARFTGLAGEISVVVSDRRRDEIVEGRAFRARPDACLLRTRTRSQRKRLEPEES